MGSHYLSVTMPLLSEKKWKSYFQIYSKSQCLLTGLLHGHLLHEDYHFLRGIRFSRLQIPAICGIHHLIGSATTFGLAGQGIGRISLSKSVPGLRSVPCLINSFPLYWRFVPVNSQYH